MFFERKKIFIIGDTGSGKTTLSKDLSVKFKIPCCDLDAIYWKVRFSALRGEDERRQLLSKVISKDEWVIAGIPEPWNRLALQEASSIVILERSRIA